MFAWDIGYIGGEYVLAVVGGLKSQAGVSINRSGWKSSGRTKSTIQNSDT